MGPTSAARSPVASRRRWCAPVAALVVSAAAIAIPAIQIGAAPAVPTTVSGPSSAATTAAKTQPPCTPAMDGNVALGLCTPGTPFVASDSIWNTPLPANTSVNPNQADYLNIIEDNECGIDPAVPGTTPVCTPNIYNEILNITTFSAPLYVVPANEPTYTMTDNCGRPTDFLGVISGGVPIPADAQGSPGSDGEIIIYQPSTNSDWEFWQFKGSPSTGFSACWGGEMADVSTSNGVFPHEYGADATSLAELGANVRIDELQAGQIDHAIGLEIGDDASGNLSSGVDPANVTDPNSPQPGVSLPATHGDGGSKNPDAIPEGTRFRLPANLNLGQYNLTPIAHAIAVAAQQYGLIVNDSSPTPTLTMRLGDPLSYTNAGLADPYTSGVGVGDVNDGNLGLLDGGPQDAVMANFPWGELQALPYDYGNGPPSHTHHGHPVKCSSVKGTSNGTIQIGDCTPSAGSGYKTASGLSMDFLNDGTGGTLTWRTSGATTTIGDVTSSSSTGKAACSSQDTEWSFTGRVTADSTSGTGIPAVGEAISGKICVAPDHKMTLAKGKTVDL